VARLKRLFNAALAAAACMAILQAVAVTLLAAWTRRNSILAPNDFVPLYWWDAFTRYYDFLCAYLPLPGRPTAFIGPGFLAKLDLSWGLLAVNAVVAFEAAAAVTLLMLVFRAGDTDAVRRRALCWLLGLEAAVIAGGWFLRGVPQLLNWASLPRVAQALTWNFIFDGTALALLLLAGCALASWSLVDRLPEKGWKTAAALLAIATSSALVAQAKALPTATAIDATLEERADPAGKPLPALAPGYNLVLVSIDSLRSDHLDAYGYHRSTAPTISELAAKGVLFRNNSSASSWTLPAHMSMLTGRSLLGHGVTFDDRSLTADVPTLAESLKGAGYRTGAVVSAPYVEARYGFDRGFDDYDDRTISFATNGESYKTVTAPLLQKTAASWLARNAGGDEPFFLFLHYWDVHYDYAPGAPYDTMFDPSYDGDIDGRDFYFNPGVHPDMASRDLDHLLALYDGEIRLVDDHLAKLRSTLAELGVAQNTIIVITSDHGDEFFEHGGKGHHKTLFDEVTRVPLVLYVPGVAPTRPVVKMETSIVDIMPTLLSLLGVTPSASMDGENLSGIAFHGEKERDRSTLAELYRLGSRNYQSSLRSSGRKVTQLYENGDVYAYDIARDPAEQQRLDSSTGFVPDVLRQMADTMNRLWPVYSGRLDGETGKLEMDDATRSRLEALGYMDQ